MILKMAIGSGMLNYIREILYSFSEQFIMTNAITRKHLF